MVAEDRQPWAASERAVMWKTVGVNSPAILYMLGIISREALRGGEGRAEGTGGQRAVQCPGHPAFGLHLGDDRNGVPYVLLLDGRFRVRFGRHRRGWRNGVDGDDFAGGIGDMGAGLVAVDGDHSSRHELFSSVGTGCAARAARFE